MGAEQDKTGACRRGWYVASPHRRFQSLLADLCLAHALRRLARFIEAIAEFAQFARRYAPVPILIDLVEFLAHRRFVFGQRDNTVPICVERHWNELRRVLLPTGAGLFGLPFGLLLNLRSTNNAVAVAIRLERVANQFVQLETNLLRGGLKLHAIGVDHLSRPRLHHGRNLVLANGSVAVQVVIQNLRGGLRTPLGHDASAQIVETLWGDAALIRITLIECSHHIRPDLLPSDVGPHSAAHPCDDPFRARLRRRSRPTETGGRQTKHAKEPQTHFPLHFASENALTHVGSLRGLAFFQIVFFWKPHGSIPSGQNRKSEELLPVAQPSLAHKLALSVPVPSRMWLEFARRYLRQVEGI